MGEAAEAMNVWAVLLPVIVGGLLGVLGTTFGPLIAHWQATRTANQKHRVERFEELLGAVYANDLWLEHKRSEWIFNAPAERTMAPLSRAISIAAVYFPELVQPLRMIEYTGRSYQLWMIDASTKQRIQPGVDISKEEFSTAYDPYLHAFTEFHNLATQHATNRKGRV